MTLSVAGNSCQTLTPYWTKVAQWCLLWFDNKSESPTSSISVAGITRCRSQIDYISNLKANNDVIISSLEKRVEFDSDEEKHIHYANRSSLSLSLSWLSIYLHHLAIRSSSVLYQIWSDSRLIKWWIIINSYLLIDHITNLAVHKHCTLNSVSIYNEFAIFS